MERKTSKPVWSQSDTEAPLDEQERRLARFRVVTLGEIKEDCARLVEFCEEWRGAQLYTHFAPTWAAFCADVLGIEPAWVDEACAARRLLRDEEEDSVS